MTSEEVRLETALKIKEVYRVTWKYSDDPDHVRQKHFHREQDACGFMDKLKEGFDILHIEWDGRITLDSVMVW